MFLKKFGIGDKLVMSKFSAKYSFVILLGSLNLGFAEVAQADMKWFETLNGYCPEVCQKNARTYKKGNPFHKEGEYIDKKNAAYKFAVPGGINPRATKARGSESVYYVCVTHFSGWRIGYNIDYQQYGCYTGFRKYEHYGEHYLCLCTDQEMPPLPTDGTGYIKRR